MIYLEWHLYLAQTPGDFATEYRHGIIKAPRSGPAGGTRASTVALTAPIGMQVLEGFDKLSDESRFRMIGRSHFGGENHAPITQSEAGREIGAAARSDTANP